MCWGEIWEWMVCFWGAGMMAVSFLTGSLPQGGGEGMDFGDVFAQHAFLTLSHRERGQNGGWDFFIFRWPLGAVGVMLFVFCCGVCYRPPEAVAGSLR